MDGNLRALKRYEDEMDSHYAFIEAQKAIDESALVEAESGECKHGSLAWYYGDEFAELVDRIKAHQAAGNSGPSWDWQPDDEEWTIVHGLPQGAE